MSTSQKTPLWIKVLISFLPVAGLIIVALINKPESYNKPEINSKNLMLAGTVIDENGNGISRALVQIVGKSTNSYTESNGNFRFEVTTDPNLSENRVSIIVSHKGYISTNQTVILPNETVQIQLEK